MSIQHSTWAAGALLAFGLGGRTFGGRRGCRNLRLRLGRQRIARSVFKAAGKGERLRHADWQRFCGPQHHHSAVNHVGHEIITAVKLDRTGIERGRVHDLVETGYDKGGRLYIGLAIIGAHGQYLRRLRVAGPAPGGKSDIV